MSHRRVDHHLIAGRGTRPHNIAVLYQRAQNPETTIGIYEPLLLPSPRVFIISSLLVATTLFSYSRRSSSYFRNPCGSSPLYYGKHFQHCLRLGCSHKAHTLLLQLFFHNRPQVLPSPPQKLVMSLLALQCSSLIALKNGNDDRGNNVNRNLTTIETTASEKRTTVVDASTTSTPRGSHSCSPSIVGR